MPKIFIVGFLVAISQLVGVATSSYLSVSNEHELLALWAKVESILTIVTSIIFFGHQHYLNRELINHPSVEVKIRLVRNTQETMLPMSLVCAVLLLCIAVAQKETMFFWLAIASVLIGAAPVFSLYGLSKPIHAGFISLLKIGVPNLTVFLLAYFHAEEFGILFFGIILAYVLAAIAVGIITQIGLKLPTIKFSKLKRYLSGYKLGVPSFALTALRAAPVLTATILYPSESVVALILFYKYLLLGLGVKRLFVQTYYSKVGDKAGAIQIDLICLALVVVVIGVMYLFSSEIMYITGFGEAQMEFNACLVIVFLNFVGVSNGTRLILLNKDSFYLIIHMVSLAILAGFLFYSSVAEASIFVFYGGIVAELVLLMSALLGRVYYEMHA